eukprot:CAMPEP_0176441922 /NCGR_PEP_ID=MMETSP0127-20121128/21505_1 /TAXON_ID=938130 /ORGANISM="Platyophrya macrostoma, Strain WH" /LENGTH=225 /DNA_ID=CAMNT_0017826831 /DNA_START=32 /DNA_END=705 /DNA_ORIENTATION=+
MSSSLPYASVLISFIACVLAVVGAAAAVNPPPAMEDVGGVSADDAQQCIAWSDFSALTFNRGTSTQTRRRTSNIPSLNCVGNCPSEAILEAAHCTQVGLTDAGTPSWKCLPQFGASRQGRFAFGSIRVECEGCRRRGDSEITKGSCALFYSVVDQSTASMRGRRSMYDAHHQPSSPHNGDILHTILFVCFVCFAVIMARRICCPPPPPVYFHPNGAPVQGVPVQG